MLNAKELLKAKSKWLVVDIETGSLDAKHDSSIPLHCIGLKTLKFSVSLEREEGLEKLQSMIDDGYVVIVHNASFDIAALRTYGVRIARGEYFDTMLASYCIRPSSSRFHSLEWWGETFGIKKIDYLQALKNKGLLPPEAKKNAAFELGFNPVMEEYNIRDCEITWLLMDYVLQQFILDGKVWKAYRDIELPYVEVVMAMEANGLHFDKDKLEDLAQECERELAPLEKQITEMGGYVPSKLVWVVDKNFKKFVPASEKKYKGGKYRRYGRTYYNHCSIEPLNPNSGAQVAYFLMKQGWKPKVFTKTGKPKMDEATVMSLAEKFPIAKAISQRARLIKLLNTFIYPILDGADDEHFIHGSFNQCETKTTRLSSSNPNLQNIPARSARGKAVRRCFTPPPGMSLLIGDMAAIEVRVLAAMLEHWMDDSRIADDIRNGIDTHERNRTNWGMESRGPTKNGFFALVYGAQLKRYALTISKPVEEAKVFFEKVREDYASVFNGMMPKVWRWCKKRREFSVYDENRNKSNVGFVYSLLGSRFHYPSIISRDNFEKSCAERESFNATIQGTCAGLFKMLTSQALETSPVTIYPAGAVHDEFLCYVSEQDAQAACEHLTKTFSEFVLMGVPIKAEFKVCGTWNDKG